VFCENVVNTNNENVVTKFSKLPSFLGGCFIFALPASATIRYQRMPAKLVLSRRFPFYCG
jgi:hypothetical protein